MVDSAEERASLPLWAPNWPVPSHVKAVMTTRRGGVSLPPWNSLNLGDHVGDDVELVHENRRRVSAALGAQPVFLQQVHGHHCVTLSRGAPDGQVADASATTKRRLACTAMVADCLPVLLTDKAGRAVAAAHAGWRGLCGTAGPASVGVLEVAIDQLRHLSLDAHEGSASKLNAPDCLAWLGPCIGPRAFEVGSEVRTAFLNSQPGTEAMFEAVNGRRGHYLADLAGLARHRLRSLGVTQVYGNDGSLPWCTVGNGSTWFSHRRSVALGQPTGRMAACIWLA